MGIHNTNNIIPVAVAYLQETTKRLGGDLSDKYADEVLKSFIVSTTVLTGHGNREQLCKQMYQLPTNEERIGFVAAVVAEHPTPAFDKYLESINI